MSETDNKNRLFYGSCFALITTAFTFSIRAGILPQLGQEFNLTAEQLGFINSMWFLGFPISMIIGGLVYYSVGPKVIMQVALLSHAIGILLTIYAGGYWTLIISTLFIGFGNGCTEAACNPMIADSYSGTTMNKMLNRFHMWFPGGIVIGSLISKFMTDAGMTWQSQIWVLIIPTLVYAYLFWGQTFPKPKIEGQSSLAENFKAMISPVYIFLFVFMAFTAISEFGPQQWVNIVLNSSGVSGMVLLALTTGVMAVGRFFAGPVVKALGQTGVLLGGAIFTFIGIYLFSTVTGPMAYAAAVIFAIGVCYFWPVMVGAVAQRAPLSGALGMSIVGGVGMFSTSIWQPIIGGWIDDARAEALSQGLTGDALELAAGQETLTTMLFFPGILIVAFTIFFFWQKGKKPAVEAAH
ncbi:MULTISPECIES: sugar MFS transporter [unclassified Imperialibacter]|jgi:predicted MFS family arabinose efflux permease|uniref:MFS transporter n=1 Tax=unclassified Imperialibacter TaxID=2629706 RepID=UPI00125586C7|nr:MULTISPECIES: MFS transporter [unclassified Imperialibacter]CAD5281033.1 Fucose permease [Imperialibacter sp. 75]CAD5296353.1 Fucose permease [Imperialibacter sp. 89]VVT27765.1 Fucose permease [Imperialibacter sp. EC-SDR9]